LSHLESSIVERCRIKLVLDTSLMSFANRWSCEEVSEFAHLLLVVAGLFIGNGILFIIQEGDRNTFACFAISEKIGPTIPSHHCHIYLQNETGPCASRQVYGLQAPISTVSDELEHVGWTQMMQYFNRLTEAEGVDHGHRPLHASIAQGFLTRISRHSPLAGITGLRPELT